MWITPTVDMVFSEGMSPGEAASVRAISGNPEKIAQILQRAVAEAQGAISAAGNGIDIPGTIPDQVVPHVLAIVIYRVLHSSAGTKVLVTDDRKAANTAALEYFAKVAEGRIKIERPANPAPTTGPVIQIPVVLPGRLSCDRNFNPNYGSI